MVYWNFLSVSFARLSNGRFHSEKWLHYHYVTAQLDFSCCCALMYFRGTWTQWYVGRVSHMTSTDMGQRSSRGQWPGVQVFEKKGSLYPHTLMYFQILYYNDCKSMWSRKQARLMVWEPPCWKSDFRTNGSCLLGEKECIIMVKKLSKCMKVVLRYCTQMNSLCCVMLVHVDENVKRLNMYIGSRPADPCKPMACKLTWMYRRLHCFVLAFWFC